MQNVEQNNLSLLNFKFKLERTPDIEYRAQSVSLPGLSLSTANMPTPFVEVPFPGRIDAGDLTIRFLVGENMKDYLSIYNWMSAIGLPEKFEDYRNWFSDCTVFILDSNLKPNLSVRFTDAFPIQLSGIEFDTTLAETQYATASVTFKYTLWYLEDIIY
jgi:hypothetical protein